MSPISDVGIEGHDFLIIKRLTGPNIELNLYVVIGGLGLHPVKIISSSNR